MFSVFQIGFLELTKGLPCSMLYAHNVVITRNKAYILNNKYLFCDN